MIEKLQKILRDYLDDQSIVITNETNLLNDFDMDSFELITLIGNVEEELGIEIEDSAIYNMNTIGDIIAFLEKN